MRDDALDAEVVRLRRRSVRIVLAVWVPLLLLGAGALVWVLDPFGLRPGCAPDAPPAEASKGPGWSGLAPAPLPTVMGSAMAWTGDDLVVYGGDAAGGRDRCVTGSAAAYDPSTGAWRSVADPPFKPLYQPQMLTIPNGVFTVGQPCTSQRTPQNTDPGCRPGGLAAAVYHPSDDRWEKLDVDPEVLDGTGGDDLPFIAGWDGVHVVLRSSDRLISYNPTTNEWQRWPLPPRQFFDGMCVVDGAVVAVDVFRPDIVIDKVEDRVDRSPLVSVSRNGSPWSPAISSHTGTGPSPAEAPVCAGNTVLVDNVAFDSEATSWRPSAAPPAEIGYFQDGQVAWTGDRLAIIENNTAATYEPRTDTWSVLGRTDKPNSWQPVWADGALVYQDPRAPTPGALIAAEIPAGA